MTIGFLCDELDGLPGVRHRFFSRQGGVSQGPFASLNVGFASGDDPELVRKNRRIALAELADRGAAFVNCYQIHSNKVVYLDRPNGDIDPRADAMVSDVPGLALSITAADCVPVLFADGEAGVIAAAHVGWRGAASGVLENTVSLMLERGARADRIVAATGPAIQPQSYEVGDDVREAFSPVPGGQAFFSSKENGRYSFDLPGMIECKLNGLVAACVIDRRDTYAGEDLFFSARRSAHRGEKSFGRMLSTIMLV